MMRLIYENKRKKIERRETLVRTSVVFITELDNMIIYVLNRFKQTMFAKQMCYCMYLADTLNNLDSI